MEDGLVSCVEIIFVVEKDGIWVFVVYIDFVVDEGVECGWLYFLS